MLLKCKGLEDKELKYGKKKEEGERKKIMKRTRRRRGKRRGGGGAGGRRRGGGGGGEEENTTVRFPRSRAGAQEVISWAEVSGQLEGVREAEEAEEGVVPGRA